MLAELQFRASLPSVRPSCIRRLTEVLHKYRSIRRDVTDASLLSVVYLTILFQLERFINVHWEEIILLQTQMKELLIVLQW
jgi:hypothetical protein